MPRSSLLIAALLSFAAQARGGDAPGAYFKNEAWGYKVKVPKSWRQAAISADERWIASKHLGRRELEAVKSGWWMREEPEMWVIGFPHIRTAQQEGAAEVGAEGKEGESDVDNPYADYQDFVARHKNFIDWSGGDYHVAKSKEGKQGKVKVTRLVITAQRREEYAPRIVVTWVYHFDDIDFAIQFKILEEHYDEYEGTFRACLKSFRRIERKRAIPGTASAGDAAADAPVDLEKLSPAERKLALKDAVERKFQREIEGLPKGWKNRRSKHFLALYNANEEYTRETIAHAEAVRAHIEKLFGGVGSEYVPPVVLRIFATEGETEAYRQGSGGSKGLVQEVLVTFGQGYVRDNEWESLNKKVFLRWLGHRNKNLEAIMPRWIKEGLDNYMGMLRSRGRKVRFSNEDWDRDWVRDAIRKNEYITLRELITGDAGSTPAGVSLDSWDRDRQARSVVFWLMRDGNRGKYKNFVVDYVDYLVVALKEAEDAVAAQPEPEGEDAPEPDAARAVAEMGPEILAKVHERAFGKWSDRDWDRFTKAWLSHAK